MANETTARSDYPVCYQCRLRKIRCDRERPKCSNCVRFGFDCEWSGSGKKKNQTALMAKTINELRTRLDHLVDSVFKIETSMQNLRSQIPTVHQSVHHLPQTPRSSFSMRTQDFANTAIVPPPSSHDICPTGFNTMESSINSRGGLLPHHVSAALEILAIYDADSSSHSQSGSSNTYARPSFNQHRFLQTVHNLSTTESGNTALTALFDQLDHLAAEPALAKAMCSSGTSTPHSVQDDQSVYSYTNSLAHTFTPIQSSYSQQSYPGGIPVNQPGEGTLHTQMSAHPVTESPNGSRNSEDLMAQHHAFIIGAQDPLPLAPYLQETPGDTFDFPDL